MTKKLYYLDSLATDFEAEVVSCEKCGKSNLYELILDQTLFYPEGGGQPCDLGNINGLAVTDVKSQDDEIIHYITAPMEKGTRVTGKIDFDRRLDLMQQHTGEHIVSGLINHNFGYDNVGFHIGSDFVTLDFNGILSEKDLEDIEKSANRAIYENQPVTARVYTHEEISDIEYRSKKEIFGDIRIVRAGKCDTCACCGTHLPSTGSVGVIKLVNSQNYKGGTRIFMLAGKRALKDYQLKNQMILSLSAKTSSKPYDTEKAVDKIISDFNNLKLSMNSLKAQLIEYKIKEIPAGTEKVCIFEEDMNPVELRKFCTDLCERVKIALVLCGNDEKGYKYAFGASEGDIKDLSKKLNKELNGKGGGSGNVIQGSLSSDEINIRKFIDKL